MSDIGQHIVRYRKAAGLTQDELGESLHVTRQAVSSWENGRTIPDVQMLSDLAECLGVSIEQIIYGRGLQAEPRDVKRYKRTALLAALIAGACACASWLIHPHLGRTIETYRILPELFCMSILRPVAYLSVAVCSLSLLSVIADISIRNYKWRRSCLIAGAGLLLIFVWLVFVVYADLPGGLWAHYAWFWTVNHPYVFVCPAVCLFFGINCPT